MTASKDIGTRHESAIVAWLLDHGWPWAHRRAQKGKADQGDVCLSERIPFTIEAKSSRKTTDRMAVGTWLKELEAEVNASGDESGAVVYKRRGTTDVGESVVLMPMKYLNVLLTRAYGGGEILTSKSSVRKRSIPR